MKVSSTGKALGSQADRWGGGGLVVGKEFPRFRRAAGDDVIGAEEAGF